MIRDKEAQIIQLREQVLRAEEKSLNTYTPYNKTNTKVINLGSED